MRFTDMADEMFGAAQGALPAGVRLATAKRGGVTITRVEIAREGLAKPRGRYVTLEMPSVSVLDERDAAVIETCAAELRACCAACPDSILKDSPSADTRHGFRIDTGRYSYMLVCSFRSADCRFVVKCFFISGFGSAYAGS